MFCRPILMVICFLCNVPSSLFQSQCLSAYLSLVRVCVGTFLVFIFLFLCFLFSCFPVICFPVSLFFVFSFSVFFVFLCLRFVFFSFSVSFLSVCIFLSNSRCFMESQSLFSLPFALLHTHNTLFYVYISLPTQGSNCKALLHC